MKKITKDNIGKFLIRHYPEYKEKYIQHMREYGDFLGTLFFEDVIVHPIVKMYPFREENIDQIKRYCELIEQMWREGDERVKSYVDVPILEVTWYVIEEYLSPELRLYMNTELSNTAVSLMTS